VGGYLLEGNDIGTNAAGTAALGNSGDGVFTFGAPATIGGTVAGARNVISSNGGIGIDGGPFLVQGNYVGTDVTGTHPLGNLQGGILANGTIGGDTPEARNLVSGNRGYGIDITGGLVQGNYVGTDATGTGALGNAGSGVVIGGSDGTTIGGPGAGNVISANGGDGIFDPARPRFPGPLLVQGNRIGTDVTGTQPLGNGGDGVHITGRSGTIGGAAEGAGNTIAFNGNDGVLVDASTGNTIQQNSIFSNANLGIELINGGNRDQPSPVLTSATSDGSSTTVRGTLTIGAPDSTFTVELFANTECNPSGYGEGERFLGPAAVTTDAAGNATFAITLAAAVAPGQFLTATDTDPEGDTSAFSQCVTVRSSVLPGQTEDAAFWHSGSGQALLRQFDGGPSATALANWLAASFPNLYGASAGADDLSGQSNAQVAAFFQGLFAEGHENLAVQVLATALNVYAMTASLGGNTALAYGLLVTAGGLGASSFDVGPDGAAFGVADHTALTVNQLLQAVDQRAAHGVLYAGHRHLRGLAEDLFERLNRAGG
jgi:hypothetical protein